MSFAAVSPFPEDSSLGEDVVMTGREAFVVGQVSVTAEDGAGVMVMMLLLLLRVGLVELRQGIFGNSIFEPAFGPPLSPFPFFLRLLPPLLFKEAKIETAIT